MIPAKNEGAPTAIDLAAGPDPEKVRRQSRSL